MSKNLQIDISALSEAQKMMCMKLLAQADVNFSQHQNKFTAQLKIKSNIDLTKQIFQQNKLQPTKQLSKITQKQPKQEKQNQHQKDKDKVKPGLIYPSGKKPLNRILKGYRFPAIQQLIPFIQLYIYPKRMSIQNMVEQCQKIYEKYWHRIKPNRKNSFPEFVVQEMQSRYKQKIKYQQHLVNFLDSLLQFRHKIVAIRIFTKLMSQQFNKQVLNYYLVLRELIHEIMGDGGAIDKNINRLKAAKYERQIQEHHVKQFLKICCIDLKNQQSFEVLFGQMTKIMYFDQKKNKNYIEIFTMLQYLIQEFNRINSHEYNLELSYSQNDSTLNQLLFHSNQLSEKKQKNPIIFSQLSQKTFIEADIVENSNSHHYKQEKKPPSLQQQLYSRVQADIKKMCNQMNLEQQHFLKLGKVLLSSIINQDKGIWLGCLQETAAELQINYIQSLQQQYISKKGICFGINNFVKKLLLVPSFRQAIIKHFKLI